MSLKEVIQNEPVKFAAALGALGVAVSALLALITTAAVAGAVLGVWTSAIGVYNVLFTRNQVTPNTHVVQTVHDTIVALAPFAPVVTEAIVPVASSPLLDTSVAITDNSVPLHPPTQ